MSRHISYLDDLDDSYFLTALEQVESTRASVPQASVPSASVPALASVPLASVVTNTMLGVPGDVVVVSHGAVPTASTGARWDALTSEHVPKMCKCMKQAAVKVVLKQGVWRVWVGDESSSLTLTLFFLGPNTGKRFYSCASQTCGFFDWVVPSNRLPTPLQAPPLASTASTADSRQAPVQPMSTSALLHFEAISDAEFCVTEARGELAAAVRDSLLTSLPGARVADGGRLQLPLSQYQACKAKLAELHVRVASDLPAWIVDVFVNVRYAKVYPAKVAVDQRALAERVPASLLASLFPFQRQGVEFAISRNGRCLIGDDMGLGKTVQAIAVAAYYRADWPLLIFCPASMRVSWAEQLQRWLPDLSQDDIGIVWNGSSPINRKVVIMSYDLMSRMTKQLQEQEKKRPFHFLIADESHMLKNSTSQRAKAIVPILMRAKHAVLLSGTAACSRPQELFTQLRVLDARIFRSYADFGKRYCNGYAGTFGWNFDGASHLAELNALLRATVMVRRLKVDVMSQLPEKTRRKALLHIPSKHFAVLEAVSKRLKSAADKSEQRGLLLEMYADVGRAKLPAAIEYVREMLEGDTKLLLFAHHKDVLDGFEGYFLKQNIGCIRIDGTTQQSKRQQLVDVFQSDSSDCRIALLSMTAAGTGLTLTAAHSVVFAELWWVPGQLRQCEDRAHRIGQRSTVDVRYLVAKNTMDEQMWGRLQSKLDVVGTALDGVGDHAMNTRDEERFIGKADSIASDDLVAEIVKQLDSFQERDDEIRGRRDRRRARAAAAVRDDDADDDADDNNNNDDDGSVSTAHPKKRANIMVPMDDVSDEDADEQIRQMLQRDRVVADEFAFVDETEP
jgi:SWI/SNF-related matrix-associated actin-dependent regulator 1 of chromatin subfamily A